MSAFKRSSGPSPGIHFGSSTRASPRFGRATKLGCGRWHSKGSGAELVGERYRHRCDPPADNRCHRNRGGTGQLTNNLVFWQNRYGHANRDHRFLLEAAASPKLRAEADELLFAIYRSNSAEGQLFERLSAFAGAKYPLVAYLFFLRDLDRFMPIQPTGFDRAFRALGIEFSTLRQCGWEN